MRILVFILAVAHARKITDWQLASSNDLDPSIDGKTISSSQFQPNPSAWQDAKVPSTVFATLLANQKIDKDPFFAENLQNISSDPYDVSWWYRAEIEARDENSCKYARLLLKGVNYKANLFINGEQIANTSEIVGTFRYFYFDVTKNLAPGRPNVIAAEVLRPHNRALPSTNKDTDLAMSFVDWAPSPPDSNMGLWGDVVLECSPHPIFIDSPAVESSLSSDNSQANLSVVFEVSNLNFDGETPTRFEITIAPLDIMLMMDVTLAAGESKTIICSSEVYPQLSVTDPKLWWPAQMGDPALLPLQITAVVSNARAATLTKLFGIRQIRSGLNSNGHRQYFVNGKKILIRGAGWSPDLFLRMDAAIEAAEFEYVRDLGLNSIRLEGKFPPESFFERADKFGILILPGWCCCDSWQHWSLWGEEQLVVARESLRSQVRRLRIHPSMLVFMYSSDELPPKNVEELYLDVFSAESWPAEVLSAASDRKSEITGPTGVKMSGPYSWVPPVYWTQDLGDKKLGGAWGFLTEGGPGASPMTFDSMSRTIPEEQMWPLNDDWLYHTGNPIGAFRDLRYFLPALSARYGDSTDAPDFLMKSQVMTYEAQRAMFEAYSMYKYAPATGVIQWMLNNAWPENIWHLFDSYLGKGGGYYGARTAMQPVQSVYNPSTHSISVVNSLYSSQPPMEISAKLFDIDGRVVFSEFASTGAELIGDSVTPVGITLPEVTAFRFLLLETRAHASSPAAAAIRNVYWLPPKWDVLNWNESTYITTNCSSFASFAALSSLSCPDLSFSSSVSPDGQIRVRLKNGAAGAVAFFIHLSALDNATGKELLPVIWSDNYVTLFPGESQELAATFPGKHETPVADIKISVETFNTLSGQCQKK